MLLQNMRCGTIVVRQLARATFVAVQRAGVLHLARHACASLTSPTHLLSVQERSGSVQADLQNVLCALLVHPKQDIAEDQLLLARLVHNLRSASNDNDEQFEMLQVAQVGVCPLLARILGLPCWNVD